MLFVAIAAACGWSYHQGIDADANWGWWSDATVARAVEFNIHVDGGLLLFKFDTVKVYSPMIELGYKGHLNFDEKLSIGYHLMASGPLGFSYEVNTQSVDRDSATIRNLTCPGWAALMVTAILPVLRVRRRLRRRALKRSNRCNSCGYNLTANTTGVCPECGTAVSPIRRDSL